MGQRSTLCMYQVSDLDSEPNDGSLHPNHGFFTGNASNYTNKNSHLALSSSGNTVHNHFRDHHERIMLNGNQYNNIQNFHTIHNIGSSARPNFYNSNMLLVPSGTVFPPHQDIVMGKQLPSSISHTNNGVNMNEFSRHNQLIGSDRGSCKRKNLEVIPGIYFNLNGSVSSSLSGSHSLNCGVPQWGLTYESVPSVVDPGYGGRAPFPGAEEPHRSARSRSVSFCLQPEFAFLPHQNCLLPGSYMTYPIHPVDNARISQFGNENNIGDASSAWDYSNIARYLQGRSLNPGPLQLANLNTQTYTGSSSGADSAMLFHPTSMPNFHPPVHNLQVQGYSHHAPIPDSYQHPVNNLCAINSNHSGAGMDVRSAFPHFTIGHDQIYRPQQVPQPTQRFSSGRVRILPSEDDALMDLSGFYGLAIDQHQDLRLDIDAMSYEELLALEEHIGDVKTGLEEESIMKNLNIGVHTQETALTAEQSSRLSLENEACTICQVEYEDNNVIGTLDCGHTYHVDCIKQWLLIKNLCPICKTSALATKDERS